MTARFSTFVMYISLYPQRFGDLMFSDAALLSWILSIVWLRTPLARGLWSMRRCSKIRIMRRYLEGFRQVVEAVSRHECPALERNLSKSNSALRRSDFFC